jgi:hypothetical protein
MPTTSSRRIRLLGFLCMCAALPGCTETVEGPFDPTGVLLDPAGRIASSRAAVVPFVNGSMADGEWDDATAGDFRFVLAGEYRDASLYAKNDSQTLYLALVVFADDYFEGRNGLGNWADDRLFVAFDEHNDGLFAPGEEDRLSLSASERGSLPGYVGDWYWYDSTFRWEADHPDAAKRGVVSHSGEGNGSLGDYLFELSIPLNCTDPYDLQTRAGEQVGFCITFGNPHNGYAHFPSAVASEDDPAGFGVLALAP